MSTSRSPGTYNHVTLALTPGTRLGGYTIGVQIGEGGMGQVFRATDTRLKRQVALKILPPAVAADPERLARFQREAEVLASLNHPNIAAIYGLEESGATTALVMELVEGDDLSQRIARSAIPLDEALPIAKQIANALEAAHEQGIIHRDLKPANIKVRADGTVKVLDFGLAKAMEPAVGSSASASMSPTITTPAMTQAGMVLGTAAYMSPEQAKGRTVDRRADVWAFGAVFYEMLTGRRAFAGDDVSDTFVAIMRDEPDWTRLPATLSPSLGAFIRRCLHKDPKQRIPDIATMRLALEGAFETPGPQTTSPAPAAAFGGRVVWPALGVVSFVAAMLVIPTVRHLRETPPPAPSETRTDIVTPASSDPGSFALSPDGRQIVFVASGDGASRLWLRSLDSTTSQPLAGTEGATTPFWAPDSRSVAFFADANLKRLDIGGGTPLTLTTGIGSRGGTWSATGIILFTPTTSSQLFRVPATGGQAVSVTKLDRQGSHRAPVFLPDGRRFLYYALGTQAESGIYLGSLDSPETTRLTAADTGGAYLAGWLLWVRSGSLVAQRLDLERRGLTGDVITVAERVPFDANTSMSALSVSASGLLAYRTGAGSRRQLAWFDRSGKPLGTFGERDENGLSAPSVSSDGRRVVLYRTMQGNADIWLGDAVRATRFTFDAALDRFPVWAPDGSRVVFDSNRNGKRNLYQKASSGAGAESLLLESSQDKLANDWSLDGRFLVYHSTDAQTNRDLWVLPMEGDQKPWLFLKTTFNERFGAFSPDGRWIAYMSNESGRDEIYIRPFAAPTASGANTSAAGGQWQVSTAGGIYPRWRHDGKELYYLGPRGEMMAASIVSTATALTPGAPVVLFPTLIYGGGVDTQLGRQYDVASDGRFLLNTVLDDATAPITLLMNWNPAARK